MTGTPMSKFSDTKFCQGTVVSLMEHLRGDKPSRKFVIWWW